MSGSEADPLQVPVTGGGEEVKEFAVKNQYPLSSCSRVCILGFVVADETIGSREVPIPFLTADREKQGPRMVSSTTLQGRREQVESRGGSFRSQNCQAKCGGARL